MKNPFLYLFLLLFVQNTFGQINGRYTIKLRDTTIEERPYVKGVFEGFEFRIHKREFSLWGDNEMFNFKVIKQGQISQLDSLNNQLSYKLSDTIRGHAKQMFVEKIDKKLRSLVIQVLPNTEGSKYGYRVGEVIEDMNFMTVDNKVFNNRGKEGTFILYNFWGTWCAPYIQNMPKLKAFSQTEKAKVFKIVSISVEFGFSNSLDSNVMYVKRKMKELEMDWDNVYEQNFKNLKKIKSGKKLEINNNMLKDKLNIQAFPTYIITDFNGLILHRSSDFEIAHNFIHSISKNAEVAYNSIISQLFIIDKDDQDGRNNIDDIRTKYGFDSREYKQLWASTRLKDSINLIKVEAILQKYGWLGQDKIGSQGNKTIFMVIQHSNLKTQEKYLPLMREAVKNGNAKANHLALLEDRVALRQGRKQIYGSQISINYKTNEAYVLPLEDPDNVDKRRASVGLSSISEYVGEMGIKWDLEQYKKDLPLIEAILKGN